MGNLRALSHKNSAEPHVQHTDIIRIFVTNTELLWRSLVKY